MLSEYRVLDLTDERGHLAALILAQMGAEVIAIEPPAGSSARQLGPSLMMWMTVNTRCTTGHITGVKSVVLDLATGGGLNSLKELIRSADILFESFDHGVMESKARRANR